MNNKADETKIVYNVKNSQHSFFRTEQQNTFITDLEMNSTHKINLRTLFALYMHFFEIMREICSVSMVGYGPGERKAVDRNNVDERRNFPKHDKPRTLQDETISINSLFKGSIIFIK